ncbi:uncharacterized protein MELLADRAFT_117425 [Melampsora larici-populina 98AG31]|uniref:PWWP domain-containing protein n=1 Tax=Melampsora larici-populina (strain 98AG31 / pathotype 3-4-7) TaxID=747676 RepID=F4RWZ8_MELLP|nr:uncharacterized protein MELLADRAFT_117425 [Melampsora larici-populina 98AG31]EGG03133.1 hypothetical protein MELLADRAFT_117425 [Melampsora larici-populina 98AG31]
MTTTSTTTTTTDITGTSEYHKQIHNNHQDMLEPTNYEIKQPETIPNQNHDGETTDEIQDHHKQTEVSNHSKRSISVDSDSSIEYEKKVKEPDELYRLVPSSSLSPVSPEKTQESGQYSNQTPHSLKRRRTALQSNHHPSPKPIRQPNQSPIILTSPLSSHPPTPTQSNSNINLTFEVGKVVWADIGCTPQEKYWWPGIIEKSESIDHQDELGSQNHQMMIRLFEEKGKKSKALAKERVRLISSFNKVKEFIIDLDFQPRKFNPILKVKGLSRDYPTERSLSNSYAIAYECHSVYAYEDDDELPDVGTCMIPLSQQTRSAVSKTKSTQETREASVNSTLSDDKIIEIDDDEDEEDEGPDPEINIHDEVILSKDKRKGQYWPARVTGYVGLKIVKQPGNRSRNVKPRKEKYYHIKFCDGTQVEVPRSYFLTSDQTEFHQVSIGQVTTNEIKFNKFIEVLEPHLTEIDFIVKGKSTDLSIQSQHETFLLNVKGRSLIPRDVKYGRYTEKLIVEVGHFLRDRYLTSTESNEYDPGFLELDDAQKSQYVFDILVPQLLWLVTVEQHKQSLLEDEEDSTEASILKRAQELALAELHDADIVDRVYALRNSNSLGHRQGHGHAQSDDDENGKRSVGRSTCNSQKTFVKYWDGSDSG